MAREVLKSPIHPEEETERDPMLREFAEGSMLIDQIRVQYIPKRKRANMAQGVVLFQDMLLGFRAYSPYRSPANEQDWDVYVPMDPRTIPYLPNTEPFSTEDGDRLRKTFPQAFPLDDKDYNAYVENYRKLENASTRESFHKLVSAAIPEAIALSESTKSK